MESGEWFPGVADSSKGQPITFIAMSTVDDLSYSPTENQKNRDAAQIAATGRRSWKTLKGKPEAVWPPALEGALIEALQEYQKIEARPTTSKHGVRYPMRNRFISDFIFDKTGKMRTAKQVGSRLQQLRDTCKDEKLFALLGRSPSQEQEPKGESSPSPPAMGRELTNSPGPSEDTSKIVVYMQIEFPNHSMGPSQRVPRIVFEPNDMNSPHFIYLLPIPQHTGVMPNSFSSRLSPLSLFSNLVEIASPWPLLLETNWSVYKDSTLIYRETSGLRPGSSSQGRRLYACDLVPAYWDTLCQREDPNHITIVQVLRSSPFTSSDPSSSLASAIPMTSGSTHKEVSIVYHFNLPDQDRLKFRPTSATELHRSAPTHPSSSHAPRGHDSSYPSTYQDQQNSAYWPSGAHDYSLHGSGNTLSMHPSMLGDVHTMGQLAPPINSQNYTLYNPRAGDFGGMEGYSGQRYGSAEVTMPPLYGESRASSQWSATPTTRPHPTFGRREAVAYGRDGGPCY